MSRARRVLIPCGARVRLVVAGERLGEGWYQGERGAFASVAVWHPERRGYVEEHWDTAYMHEAA